MTVLCPGFVRTRIGASGRDRQAHYGPLRRQDPTSVSGTLAAQIADQVRCGIDPADVAAQVLAAIREDELYVFTHHDANWRGELEARFSAILTAMDKAAAR